jgi:tRNA (guanine-N7-)-methyltransferase
MRKKRNLDERMLACGDILIARGSPYKNLKQAAEEYRALMDYEKVFGNDGPVQLEIGCGNGGFIEKLALRHPDRNYVAVEVCSNVILTAMEKIQRENIPNVRFLNVPAEILGCFLHEKSVECIYLNFSTPLPQLSYQKQRLTAPRFLHIYRTLLKDGGQVVQKTDSRDFFEYSMQQFTENGFSVSDVTYDLHHSEWAAENIVTEYEKAFSDKGVPICRLVATVLP